VAQDAITTEEALEVLAEEAQHQEEKAILLQDVKADSEATEVQLHVKVVLAEEANPEVHQLQELAVSLTELQDPLRHQDAMAVHQKDR
jgi:hypothetical protein